MQATDQSHISIKSDFLRQYVEQATGHKISKAMHNKNVQLTKLCLERKRVPNDFLDEQLPVRKSSLFSVKFSILLIATSIQKETMKDEGYHITHCTVTYITQEMVDAVDMEDVKTKIMEMILGTDRSECLGKYLALYFHFEGISVHQNSFYAWSKMHPTLPFFNRNKLYNSEELEAWRHFLTTKPGRKPPHQYLRA